jgi:hypothetical protein
MDAYPTGASTAPSGRGQPIFTSQTGLVRVNEFQKVIYIRISQIGRGARLIHVRCCAKHLGPLQAAPSARKLVRDLTRPALQDVAAQPSIK